VSEFTGRPGFVVPGLIAAVTAQLVMGTSSLSPYQVAGRVGHLERRLRLPLEAVMNTEARTVPPDATVEELFWQHLVGTRQQSTAVVEDGRYLGIVGAEEVGGVDREAWATTTVREVMRTDVPVADLTWLLGAAIDAMEESRSDRIAVCRIEDGGPMFVGVITAADLVELDEVLDRTGTGTGIGDVAAGG
jgi:CBS domain-containing protein